VLVLYDADLSFPDGSPAADYTVPVCLRGSNQYARLFTDSTGDTPLDNPLTTDSEGNGMFYASPGDYVSMIAGTIFDYRISTSFVGSVWPNLWVHDQAITASTWAIPHRFGSFPQVSIKVANEVVYADVAYPDDEHVTISFGDPVTGTAYLRR
jgi:hypothetical protein